MQASKPRCVGPLSGGRVSVAYHARETRLVHSRLVAIALAIILIGGGAGKASATPLKAMWGPGTHDGRSVFPTYRELGIQLYEDKLDWSVIATRRPRHPRNPNDA